MVSKPRKKRRRFGAGPEKKIRNGRTYLYYSYKTPVWAFDKWPELKLPERQWRTVSPGEEYDAEAWLAAAERDIKAGIWEPEQLKRVERKRESITFREYAPQCVEHRKRSNGSDVKQSTKQEYRKALDSYLLDYFGDKPMSEITPKDVQQWWDTFTPVRLDTDVKNRRYYIYKFLHAIMESAATEPLDDTGRTLIVSNPCLIKAVRPKVKHKPVRPDTTQLTAFYDVLPQWARMVAMICDVVGLREGEALGLRRCDIDLDNLMVHVVQQSQRVPYGKGKWLTETPTPKTDSSTRDVPMTPQLADMLREWITTRKITDPNALLITSSQTGGQIIPQTYRNAVATARKKVPGLEDMWPHDLRKDGLSSMVEAGATVSEVMRQGGHTSMSVASVYQTTGSHINEVMKRLGETKPLASAPSVEQSDDDMSALANVLASIPLDQRLTVLRSLSAARRTRVVELLPDVVKVETLTELLKGD